MKGHRGKKRRPGKAGTSATAVAEPIDHLGFLVPPGLVTEGFLFDGLRDAMTHYRFPSSGGGTSVPTRYVVTLHPADRGWLNPYAEDRLAGALRRHADRSGLHVDDEVVVELECDDSLAPGRPRYWAGFGGDDLLVMRTPGARVETFSRN